MPARESHNPVSSPSPPIRRCAACRQRLPASALVRFVLVDGDVQVDVERRCGGRGVNIHPTRSCLERASKHGAFGRGFRRPVPSSGLDGLSNRVASAYRGRLAAYLTSAVARGGACTVTSLDAVEPGALATLLEQETSGADAVASSPLYSVQNAQPGLPWAAVCGTRRRARVERLARVVSEFTFTGVGVMKRRPQTRGPDAEQSGHGESSVPTAALPARTKRPTSEKHE